MAYYKRRPTGMELLIQRHTEKFETEENINYYSYKDFVKAKRKYLKYVLEGPSCEDEAPLL
ncbi:hypothetical protein [Desulfobacula sp.]|uniref:hypothetical protein n=1 Tax=Desulfobacula sp. TaxID=2593537 RepID=UPI002614C7DD|nr:hypothetical protein [Desulfobacula sp.]